MSVEKELTLFGKRVVKEARTQLTKKKKNASKNLYNSLGYKVKVSKNSFQLDLLMDDYGEYIDKGVKGSESSKKAPNSPYRYTNKMPPTRALDKWVVRRNIKARDEKGRFIDRQSIKFAIAKSIQKTGIETTNFFTRPFELAFKKLPDELVEAYGLEVDRFLQNSLE